MSLCERRRVGEGTLPGTVRVENVPYDDDDKCEAERAREVPLDVPATVLDRLALYCVEDASKWPADLLDGVLPRDPCAQLLPAWAPWLRERRLWLAARGPGATAHVTAGFHWDHMSDEAKRVRLRRHSRASCSREVARRRPRFQCGAACRASGLRNPPRRVAAPSRVRPLPFFVARMENVHVVLTGKKEVFLVPPMEAPCLHATRHCPQAQWRLEASAPGEGRPPGGGGGARLVLRAMQSQESSSDYAVVSVDEDFQVNAERSPALAEMSEPPLWAVLHPGDAIFIPSGWWHSVRTWQPAREEESAAPFALSVNFWYLPPKALAADGRGPELCALQVMSCQRALAGSPQAHLDAFLGKMEVGSRLPRPEIRALLQFVRPYGVFAARSQALVRSRL
ncbi:unnamed protein product, partial [Prorocentrum cordatum]